MSELGRGNSILIFPENSSDGYHDVLTEYFAGFLVLAKQHFKRTKRDIKIYNMYYCRILNTIVIDKPVSYVESMRENMSDMEIANRFKDRANELRSLLHRRLSKPFAPV
jgi:hypothetical protein